MILLDTNIIINFWKKPSSTFREIFLTHKIAICGIVETELIHGARSEQEIRKILEALSAFERISIDESIWQKAGLLLYKLKKQGLTIPFQDVILATLAIEHDLDLWTVDKHFQHIQKKEPALKIFSA